MTSHNELALDVCFANGENPLGKNNTLYLSRKYNLLFENNVNCSSFNTPELMRLCMGKYINCLFSKV